MHDQESGALAQPGVVSLGFRALPGFLIWCWEDPNPLGQVYVLLVHYGSPPQHLLPARCIETEINLWSPLQTFASLQ